MQAVPITDIVKNSISSADIVTDPIIGTSLVDTQESKINCSSYTNQSSDVENKPQDKAVITNCLIIQI